MRDSAWSIPTEAAELWMMPVTTVPTARPMRGWLNLVMSWAKAGESARGLTASVIRFMPKMRTAKPTRTVPMLCFLSLLQSMVMMTPTMAKTREKFSGLSICIQTASLSMPDRLRIQEVRVVPMLAPKMMWRVWEKSMMPELTRPTIMTVVAEEDWMAMVMTAPMTRLMRGLAVIFFSSSSSLPPAIFSRLPDMTFMPKRKKARPPMRVMTEKIFIGGYHSFGTILHAFYIQTRFNFLLTRAALLHSLFILSTLC